MNKIESIVSITVTLDYFDNAREVKKTIHRFNFDEDADKDSEIKKFVYQSLGIEEYEAYNSYDTNPKRKQKCLGIKNGCGGHNRIGHVEIEFVIENEWSDI